MLKTTITHLAKTGQKDQTKIGRTLPRVGPAKIAHKGLRALPGDTVKRNSWLVKQSVGATAYWPGQYTKPSVYNDILASKDGRVEVTKEIYIPHPSSVDAEVVKKMPRGSLWFRTCVHVIPDKNKYEGEFRLKSLV